MANNRWSVPLDRLAARAGASMELTARKATFEVFRDVVLRSPVDTGRFRANWNVSYGAADVSTSTSTNESRGQAEAAKALTLPVGGVTWLSNGLAYAEELEMGSSKQAPQGMVRLAAQNFADYVQKATS